MSQDPSLELFECRLLVLDMLVAPGGVEVRLCLELGGGVTCPLDRLLPPGDDEDDDADNGDANGSLFRNG